MNNKIGKNWNFHIVCIHNASFTYMNTLRHIFFNSLNHYIPIMAYEFLYCRYRGL